MASKRTPKPQQQLQTEGEVYREETPPQFSPEEVAVQKKLAEYSASPKTAQELADRIEMVLLPSLTQPDRTFPEWAIARDFNVSPELAREGLNLLVGRKILVSILQPATPYLPEVYGRDNPWKIYLLYKLPGLYADRIKALQEES